VCRAGEQFDLPRGVPPGEYQGVFRGVLADRAARVLSSDGFAVKVVEYFVGAVLPVNQYRRFIFLSCDDEFGDGFVYAVRLYFVLA
jgi:hypothetical protein